MAAKKKKAKSKAPAKRAAPKSKKKAAVAAKRSQPKAKAAAKQAKREALPRAKPPQAKARPVPEPPSAPTPPQPAPGRTAAMPGLQKRGDTAPIGVVAVMDGARLVEESTFFTAAGRDDYVQRWEARGYACRFTPWNN